MSDSVSSPAKKAEKKEAPKKELDKIEEDKLDSILDSKNLVRKTMHRDGSCLFRSLSDQMYGTTFFHYHLREAIMNVIEANSEMFRHFIDGETFEHYVKKLRNPVSWGSELEIAAFSQAFNCEVEIYTKNGLLTTHSPQPSTRKPKLIRLCFLYGNHYDSLHEKLFITDSGMCQKIIYDIFDAAILELPSSSSSTSLPQTSKKDCEYANVEYNLYLEDIAAQSKKDKKIAKKMSKTEKEREKELKEKEVADAAAAAALIANEEEHKEGDEDKKEQEKPPKPVNEWDSIQVDWDSVGHQLQQSESPIKHQPLEPESASKAQNSTKTPQKQPQTPSKQVPKSKEKENEQISSKPNPKPSIIPKEIEHEPSKPIPKSNLVPKETEQIPSKAIPKSNLVPKETEQIPSKAIPKSNLVPKETEQIPSKAIPKSNLITKEKEHEPNSISQKTTTTQNISKNPQTSSTNALLKKKKDSENVTPKVGAQPTFDSNLESLMNVKRIPNPILSKPASISNLNPTKQTSSTKKSGS